MDESKSTRQLRFRLMLGEKCQIIQKRIEDEKIKWNNFDSPILTENYLTLMEKRFSLSGTFSQDSFIGNPPENPERSARTKH